jgi:hypothetical protein
MKKIKRKKNPLNKKYFFKIFFLILFFSAISISLISYYTYTNAIKYKATIETAIENLNESMNIENDIVKSYVRYAKNVFNPNYKIRTQDILDKHNEAIETSSKVIPDIEQFIKINFYIVIGSLSLLVLQFFIIIFIIMKFTVRYSSPTKYISNLLQKIIDGENPEERSLRKKDELKDIHKKILILAKKINKN